MLGGIAGDVVGSTYEHRPVKTTDFELLPPDARFTDDSVLMAAVALAILDDRPYRDCVLELGRRHPDAGYGGSFRQWLHHADRRPYNSWGNGSAMRVAPVGWAFDSEDQVLDQAARSAAITHDHPEGIKGAQAVALAVFMARHGADRATLRRELAGRFGYDLDRSVDGIRPGYRFDVSCQGSVPEALVCFLEAGNWEQAVRLAVSLGGDADTQACIAGAVAEAAGEPPDPAVAAAVMARLTGDLADITRRFRARYGRS